MITWTVTKKEHLMRIDEFAYHHQISRKFLKDIKMHGDILVDGIHRTVRYQLKENETICFIFPLENNHMIPEDIPFHIVYEDADIMVIDKPSNLPCIPTRAHPSHTLANTITFYYQHIQLNSTVHLVNRLDKETSGLMIVAKNRYVHELMNRQMEHIYRVYRCHVHGKVDHGKIDLPIYKDGYQMKRIIDQRGQPALTKYRCIQYEKNQSLIECRLQTGRTHQIRVHLAAIGHPLVGDPLYGEGKETFDLDSYKIAFLHPITQQIKYIEKKKVHH